MTMRGARRISPIRIISMILGGILIGFLIWLIMSVINIDIELDLVQTYEFPTPSNLSGLIHPSYGEWAVAIDGEPVLCGAEESAEGVTPCGELTSRPTASTAKMVTVLMAKRRRDFAKGDVGETITISPEFYQKYLWYVANGGSVIAVAEGEEISEYDAIASAMLPSSNNMADTLAIWAFGSMEEYKTQATAYLREIGATHTTIGTDASGFDPSTTSTAADLAKIGAYVLKDEVLAEIVGSTTREVPVAGVLHNTNTNLGKSGIIGVKTGWIGDISGYCLVNGYLIDGHIVTVAAMGAPSRADSMNDTHAIVANLQEILQPQELVGTGAEVGYYESWWTGCVPIYIDQGVRDILYSGEDVSAVLTPERLELALADTHYDLPVHTSEAVPDTPTLWQKILHAFGWKAEEGR